MAEARERMRLLVVELAAVQTELDGVREDFIERACIRLTRENKYEQATSFYEDQAEEQWAETYPALELLRDEIR